MPIVQGGRAVYGQVLGILVLDTHFPRLPGDIANASTWPFPVLYRVVPGASIDRTMVQADPTLLDPFLEGARELEAAGVRAITTSCGFLATFQRELAAAVRVPVFTSSLALVPLVHTMIGPGRRVGILTVNASALDERHFNSVGWSSESIPVAIQGLEWSTHFFGAFGRNGEVLDTDAAGDEIAESARRLMAEHPDVGVIVIECTNMAPFAHRVQAAAGGLPVFDLQVLVGMVVQAIRRTPYSGVM